MLIKKTFLFIALLACATLSITAPSQALAANTSIDSFNKAKRLLEKKIYYDHRQTLYCNASFNADKTVNRPAGFTTHKYKKRANKIEWEHVVPAENFGRAFPEWRSGHPNCVNRKGKTFKGRNCASKISKAYRLMQADMYNLFPAIGAVNAMRSNYNFTVFPRSTASSFGTCNMKITNGKAEPPESARGRIARTYIYMEQAYPRYSMSRQQRKLMEAWSKQHPVSDWECVRYQRIKMLQGSDNVVYSNLCK